VTAFYVILWIICSFAGWKIGDSKGHPALGFVLGFLLGLIGLVIIALVRPAQPRTYAYAPLPNSQQYAPPPKQVAAPMYACPSCRAPISPAASMCGSCRTAVRPSALMPPPAGTPAQWLRDPSGRFVNRYWDGHTWTEWVQNQPNEYLTDAPVPARPGA
jgi:hypothetical protein